jgi:hypothetical protein
VREGDRERVPACPRQHRPDVVHRERCDDGGACRNRAETERGLDDVAVVARDGDGEPVKRLRERPSRGSRVRGSDDFASVTGGGCRGKASEERRQELRLLSIEAVPEQLGAVALRDDAPTCRREPVAQLERRHKIVELRRDPCLER